jgi:hypothetical protein
MSDLGSNIGPSSRKRRIATVIALIGIAFVGSSLVRVWPRDVEVAFSLDPGVTALEVDYLEEGEAVASVRFRPPEVKTRVVRHVVRLQPGEYQARITVYGPDGRGVEHAKVLVVPAEGLTRFDLQEASTRPQ